MKNKIAPIAELTAIPYKDNGEPLVDLGKVNSNIVTNYRRTDSDLRAILVRKSVADKLEKVQKELELYNPQMRLLVVEGYRSLAYQEKYFMKELLIQSQANPKMDFEQLLEHTHQLVALPTVAGHPTGGAIDLTITYASEELDLGGSIADFSSLQILHTYSTHITKEQKLRRQLLHDLMFAKGFAPFYGEWWHFSYGDREWAAFYNKTEAIFSPLYMECHGYL